MEDATPKRRILVVDDDTDVRDSTCALLEAFGYTAVAAEDAIIALNTILTDPPDLVLTDIYMPNGDGYELLQAIRQTRLAIPVIVSSGGNYEPGGLDQCAKAKALGAVAVLEKPFLASRLLEVITEVVGMIEGASGSGSGTG